MNVKFDMIFIRHASGDVVVTLINGTTISIKGYELTDVPSLSRILRKRITVASNHVDPEEAELLANEIASAAFLQ